ncbi:ATP-binding response regulator [Devosia limi]|uniref:histidine kinase n=1 Tax=Devosia limi DSM 17137 TaxID=1121477 RepID=A0A1M4WRC5_9HYPH|nr:hybrid sensor histidine kinase/response regulator [Devosia limi]SHE83532.1 Signal transduction histidine kinase [Devosia limi DSM 17137]
MAERAGVGRFIAWLTPSKVTGDLYLRQRMQLFVVSHLFGPLLATPIPILLWSVDPNPNPHVPILAAAIYGFWGLIALVRLFPGAYRAVAMLSGFNLTATIIWAAYHYGGSGSPFLMWLVLTPLLGFMTLGSNRASQLHIFLMLLGGLALLFGLQSWTVMPQHIAPGDLLLAGMVSAPGITFFVFMMGIYYANVVASQSDLLAEIARQQGVITGLEETRQRAEQANLAKSEFLAKVSQELRTPLNAVIGYSDLLIATEPDKGRVGDLQMISGASQHMLGVVSDILDIGRIERAQMTLHLEDVDVDALLDRVAADARPLAERNGNTFVLERGGLGFMAADATRLRQAIDNLVANAGKFTRDGQITLSGVRQVVAGEAWIEIAVADTGTGLTHDLQLALTATLAQGMAANAGDGGMGLAISQNICRLMGGCIEMQSEPGRGSRFAIRLPVRELETETETADPVPARLLHRRSISDARALPVEAEGDAVSRPILEPAQVLALIIDDDLAFLETAERLFVAAGYTPICTDAPHAALQMARTSKPTVIFLDTLMPGFGGWDVLAALKGDPETADIAVFMLGVQSERAAALDAGAAGVIAKPLDASKIKAALAGLAATRGHRQRRSMVSA